MQPELALVYEPNAPSGMLGVGWQLTGLTSITRVNYGSGIRYQGADSYAHSKLGVLRRQPDGSFRTKKESFTKFVRSSDVCGDGPCSWIAYDRSGVKFLYGATADSRLLKHDAAQVRTWALSRVQDVYGNSYDVTYDNDASGGRLYPKRIEYTKAANLSTWRAVDFKYTAVSSSPVEDRNFGYWQNDAEYTTKRLTSIAVSTGVTATNAAGTLVRKYRLDYELAPLTPKALTSIGDTGRRARLVAVQEYGSNGNNPECAALPPPTSCALPAQTFVWQNGSDSYSQAWATSDIGQPSAAIGFLTGDMNGDGKTDVIQLVNTPPCTDTSLACFVLKQSPGPLGIAVYQSNGAKYVNSWSNPNMGQSSAATAYLAGDVNGDGRTDVIQLFDNGGWLGITVYTSNGSGFVKTWSNANMGQGSVALAYFAGDVDGDGLTDVIQLVNTPPCTDTSLACFVLKQSPGPLGITVYQSNGTAYVKSWSNPDMGHSSAAKMYLAGDLDGDGKTDIVQPFDTGAGAPVPMVGGIAYASNGVGYDPLGASQTLFGSSASDAWLVGDFLGDGHMTIVRDRGSTDVSQPAELHWHSNGGLQGLDSSLVQHISWFHNSFAWFAGDIDGDGRSNIIYLSTCGSSQLAIDDACTTQGNGAIRWLSGDMNGDGKTDVIQLWNNAGRLAAIVYTADGSTPDLMTEVRNGVGGTVTVSYAPTPQVPGAVDPNPVIPPPPGSRPNPAPRALVTSIVSTDGRGGSQSTHFSYSDLRVKGGKIPDQRNLAFAYTDTVDDKTGVRTRKYFRRDPPFEGLVSQIDTLTAQNQLVSSVTHSYVSCPSSPTCPQVDVGVDSELVVRSQTVTKSYELGVLGFTQTVTTTYDAYGNPVTVSQDADALPNVTVTTTFLNDTSSWILGRISEVKTTGGGYTLHWTKNAWVGNGVHVKSEWLNSGNRFVDTTIEYDDNGNVTSVTLPDAGDGFVRKTKTTYDPLYNAYPYTVTDALEHSSQTEYYDDGTIKSATDVNDRTTTFEYDVFGRKTTEKRPDGGTTVVAYVSFGDPNAQYKSVTTATDESRGLSTKEYFDGSGFVYAASRTGDDSKTIWVTHCKDAAGRPSALSVPYFAASPAACGDASRTWTSTTFDAAGRVKTVTTPDGKTVTHAYSATSETITDQNGNATTTKFNARKLTAAIVNAVGHTTTYGYDALGRLTSVGLPNSASVAYEYDSLNRETHTYDTQTGTTTRVFDDVGNLKSITSTSPQYRNTPKTVTFTYDALNRVKTKQPQGEAAVTYTYDEGDVANGLGRLTSVSDPSGATRYGYRVTGSVAGFTKTIGSAKYSLTLEYDLANRVTKVSYPDGSAASYAYTDGGHLGTLSARIDGNEATYATWSGYDAAGEPGSVQYGNGVATTFGFDDVSHLKSLVTTKDATKLQDLTYDWYAFANTGGLNVAWIKDNRTSKIAGDGANTDESQTYSYDALYRLTGAVGVWGTKTYGPYDPIGNPANFGGVVARSLGFWKQYLIYGTGIDMVTYDNGGNVNRKVMDGVTWDYTWTTENSLATVTKNGVLTAQMTYDAEGQRVQKVYTPASGPTVTTTYLGKWYEKRTYGDGSPERHTLYLFANDRLVAQVTRAGAIATASLEANQWRTELAAASLYAGGTAGGLARKTVQILRAVASHPRTGDSVVLGIWIVLVTGVSASLLVSVVRRTASRRRTPRLRFAAVLVVVVFSFVACSPGDPGNRLSGVRGYVVAGDTTKGPALGTYFVHGNLINSSTVVTDASGNETTRLVYLPFGELSQPNSSGGDTVTSKFTGQESDEETGLYYYGARHYDPALGRFLSADPLVVDVWDAQCFNRYSYVNNNPVNYVDPTGLFSWRTFLAGLGLIAIGVVILYFSGPENIWGWSFIASGVATIGESFNEDPDEFFITFGGPTDSGSTSSGGSGSGTGGGTGEPSPGAPTSTADQISQPGSLSVSAPASTGISVPGAPGADPALPVGPLPSLEATASILNVFDSGEVYPSRSPTSSVTHQFHPLHDWSCMISGLMGPNGLPVPARGPGSVHWNAGHYAVDISNRGPAGSRWAEPVLSMRGGTVLNTDPAQGAGDANQVVVGHFDGTTRTYRHTFPGVSPGDLVGPGDVIGWSDDSGYTSGPHIHLIIERNGNRVDPAPYLLRARSPLGPVRP